MLVATGLARYGQVAHSSQLPGPTRLSYLPKLHWWQYAQVSAKHRPTPPRYWTVSSSARSKARESHPAAPQVFLSGFFSGRVFE